MDDILANLPPAIDDDVLEHRVRIAAASSGRRIVALDDDPTGVQTVHDIPVLARWNVEHLTAALRERVPAFFVLTNSRSLPADAASDLTHQIAANLKTASALTGVPVAIASRSDSTLRGHFPGETDAIVAELGRVDGVLICPAFFEGGRITVGDVHYLRDGNRYVPVAETEFARDSTFGFTHSNLREWVEEKSGGRISSSSVGSISIEDIREGGPERVRDILKGASNGQPIVVNATGYPDLWTVALGVIQAEVGGKRFVYRCGASWVRARAGIPARPLLTRADLIGSNAPPFTPGLVIVGSHVKRAGEQLEKLLELPHLAPIEVHVAELLRSEAERERLISEAISAAEYALGRGLTPVIYTSRNVERDPKRDQLEISRSVSSALVAIAGSVERRPAWVLAKGGITSSDIGTQALGARRALVLGQIRPGVPVWRLGEEARFPSLPYVIVPGNVGLPETIAEIVTELRGG